MAVATDSNPGSSPVTSLLLMLNMACTLFRMTPEEALTGVTRNAARALGITDEKFVKTWMHKAIPVDPIARYTIGDTGQWTLFIGAAPDSEVHALLTEEGINDFDLAIDTDDNGAPGPHHLELDAVTTTVSVDEDASEVELGLGLDGVSLLMGDFQVPSGCLAPSLVGFSARFPVEPSE